MLISIRSDRRGDHYKFVDHDVFVAPPYTAMQCCMQLFVLIILFIIPLVIFTCTPCSPAKLQIE